jgi:hypothetical protein
VKTLPMRILFRGSGAVVNDLLNAVVTPPHTEQ